MTNDSFFFSPFPHLKKEHFLKPFLVLNQNVTVMHLFLLLFFKFSYPTIFDVPLSDASMNPPLKFIPQNNGFLFSLYMNLIILFSKDSRV